jgi:endo-1,4-beta-D-glucanase Y
MTVTRPAPRRQRFWLRRAVAVITALVAGAAVVVVLGRGEEPPPGSGERFLERYVEDDGRVVRHDQGGDTVSEGQAYAMLLAVAEGDDARFARVWTWTREHLRRPDGLLSWRWADGRVADADAEAAADADLDAARALHLAAERFDEPRYADESRALVRAIIARETAPAADKTVLVAGPWAQGRGVVNPSYWSPRAYSTLGFDDVAASSQRLTDVLTESSLPPDWAKVEPWGVVPTPSPAGGEPVYSYDAVRVPIRLAESCDPADGELAARMWPRLQHQPGAARRALDGTPLTDDESPAALAGAAAAAHAAGDERASRELLDRAAALDEEHPSYYGAAVVALTRTMLETGALGRC